MSTLIDSRTVTGRRDHACEECGRTIPKGERHHVSKSVGDYGWQTWRVCDQCLALCRDLWDAEVRGEDENGWECYPVLTDVDWPDVRLWSPLWARRADLYARRWDGQSYPTDECPMTEQTDPLADLIAAHGEQANDAGRVTCLCGGYDGTDPRAYAAHVAAVVRAAQADEGLTPDDRNDSMAYAWHLDSDHAEDGEHYGGPLCDCARIARRAKSLGWGPRATELTAERDAARAEVTFWQTAMQAHADCDSRDAALDAARAEVAALREGNATS